MDDERHALAGEREGQSDVPAFGEHDVRAYLVQQPPRVLHGAHEREGHAEIAKHLAAFQPRPAQSVVYHARAFGELPLDARAAPREMHFVESLAQFGQQRQQGREMSRGASARKNYTFHID